MQGPIVDPLFFPTRDSGGTQHRKKYGGAPQTSLACCWSASTSPLLLGFFLFEKKVALRSPFHLGCSK